MLKDHPRVCGEKCLRFTAAEAEQGSPPRVRGKGSPWRIRTSCNRITPACAGKRAVLTFSLGIFRDHPRVCGEKSSFDLLARHISGSPPRVRGKVIFRQRISCQVGITPACAGKSVTLAENHSKEKDHPRVCGEKFKKKR